MNVTFIGMAGAGKSYIGSRLAQRLGFQFVDTDALLEREYGKTIQRILDELGEDRYLHSEAEVLFKYTNKRDNLLIAPGGSVIYRDDAMDHLKTISTIVHLKVPYAAIADRLRDAPARAIIGLGKKTLRQLYEERMPLYRLHADHEVDMSHDTEANLRQIAQFLNVEKIRGYFPIERGQYPTDSFDNF